MNPNKNLTSTNPEKSYKNVSPYLETDEGIHSNNDLFPVEKDSKINTLLQLLENPSLDESLLCDTHKELMNIYYKKRKVDPSYIKKSTYHAKKTFLAGDPSGMAAYRLLANLTKEKKIHQAIEICEIVTDQNFQFSQNGFPKKVDFDYKKKKLIRKIPLNNNNNEDLLFNTEEVKKIIDNSNKFS